MHSLEQLFAEVVVGGLERKSAKTCSRWTELYRVAGGEKPGPWNFLDHPWSKEMHDCCAEFMAGMKAAQMAYTETMLNRTFFKMDIEGVNCAYVFPNKNPDASDFSASRFDPALELSSHLRKIFSEVKNVGHKRAGAANLWIRGSRSRIGLKSIDPSFVALDEVDEMDQDNIQLAYRRTDGQSVGQVMAISTPTSPDFGIHAMFLTTTQEHWMFRCPMCSKYIELVFPDCFVRCGDAPHDPRIRDSHVICPECRQKIDHERKAWAQRESGIWVPANRDADPERRGFYVNQLSSIRKEPYKIAFTSFEAEHKEAAEQELWNSIAGLPHVVKGGQLTQEEIAQNFVKRNNGTRINGRVITMGVDIGKFLHYEIDAWHIDRYGPDLNISATCEIIEVGKVEHFYQLHQLMQQYRPHFAVSDFQPEERSVFEFCTRYYGRAKRCQYARGQAGKRLTVVQPESELKINVNRTYWIDIALGRFRTQRITVPYDVPDEYSVNLKNLVKKFTVDDAGYDKSEYLKKGPDHYAHARTYSEIALPMAASIATSKNVRSFL